VGAGKRVDYTLELYRLTGAGREDFDQRAIRTGLIGVRIREEDDGMQTGASVDVRRKGRFSMFDTQRLIFLHGLESNSQGFKPTLLRGLFPGMLTPDFSGPLAARMAALYPILGDEAGWTIIGSSFGGLMGAIFACQRPAQVRKLVLLAPALVLPDFAAAPPAPVDVPTVVYHGLQDDVVPLAPTRKLAEQVFRQLDFHVVDDDHRLQKTVQGLDWKSLLI
jgi:pimeloyl-ACP methyl ester carboxylesterase